MENRPQNYAIQRRPSSPRGIGMATRPAHLIDGAPATLWKRLRGGSSGFLPTEGFWEVPPRNFHRRLTIEPVKHERVASSGSNDRMLNKFFPYF